MDATEVACREVEARQLLGITRSERVGLVGQQDHLGRGSDDVVAAAPEVILLPDEPYAFGPRDAQQLARLDLPASRSGRIHCVDGTWVSWYGPRIRPAVTALRSLLQPS